MAVISFAPLLPHTKTTAHHAVVLWVTIHPTARTLKSLWWSSSQAVPTIEKEWADNAPRAAHMTMLGIHPVPVACPALRAKIPAPVTHKMLNNTTSESEEARREERVCWSIERYVGCGHIT